MAIGFRAAGTKATVSSGTSITVPAPAGIAATDIVLIYIHEQQNPGTAITPPAGWTLVLNLLETSVGSERLAVFWGLGTATFGAFTGVGTNTDLQARAFAYTGVDNTTPLDVAAVGQSNASSTTMTAPTITTVTDNAWIVGVFAGADSSGGALTASDGAPLTQRSADSFTSATLVNTLADTVGDQNITPAGATGTRTATLNVAQVNIGFLIALRPATGVAVLVLEDDSIGAISSPSFVLPLMAAMSSLAGTPDEVPVVPTPIGMAYDTPFVSMGLVTQW
jgi:hypothetical protein